MVGDKSIQLRPRIADPCLAPRINGCGSRLAWFLRKRLTQGRFVFSLHGSSVMRIACRGERGLAIVAGSLFLAFVLQAVTSPVWAQCGLPLDTGYMFPTQQSGAWSNGQNLFADDNLVASASSGQQHAVSNFGFSIPAQSTITGIEVKIEGNVGWGYGGDIDTRLSWDGGATYTPVFRGCGCAGQYTWVIGGPCDLWGRTWTVNELADSNFRVRMTCGAAPCTADYVKVKVYYRTDVCGNGVLDPPNEQCDDGNLSSGDGCDDVCILEVCGNGKVQSGEQCDDGNTADGDCCSSTCQLEPGGSPCDDGILCTDNACDGAGLCTAVQNGICCELFADNFGRPDGAAVAGGWAEIDESNLKSFLLSGLLVMAQSGGLPASTEDGQNTRIFRAQAHHANVLLSGTLRLVHGGPGGASQAARVVVRSAGTEGFGLHTNPFTGATSHLPCAAAGPTPPDCWQGDGLGFVVSADSIDSNPGGKIQIADNGIELASVPYAFSNDTTYAWEMAISAENHVQVRVWNALSGSRPANATLQFTNGEVPYVPTASGANWQLEVQNTNDNLGQSHTHSAFWDDFRVLFQGSTCGTCGNGVLDAGEECDDGNTSGGDCCGAACQFENAGSPCDDANPATLVDECDGAGNCIPTLSEWGVILMSVVMLVSVLFLRRRRERQPSG